MTRKYEIAVPGSFLVTVEADTPGDALLIADGYQDIDDFDLSTWCEHDGERKVYNVDGKEYVPEEDEDR